MILIELQGGDSPRFRLEFHPRLTVVSGLDAIQRNELATSIRGALRGDRQRISLTVDIGGDPQLLTYDAILAMGLDKLDVDNVVSPADLPGAAKRRDATPAPGDGNDALDHARQELAALQAQLTETEESIAQAAGPPEQVDESELSMAAELQARSRERITALTATLSAMGVAKEELSPADELERVEQLAKTVEARIEELTGLLKSPSGEPDGMREAIEQAKTAPEVMQQRARLTSALAQAAGDWSRCQADLERLSHQPRPPDWLILQTKDQLDEAQARVNAFSYQLQEGIDVQDALERAQRQMAEAQMTWDEIEHGVEGQLAAMQERQESLYERICQLLGRKVPVPDVLDALGAQHKAVQNYPHPSEALVELLAQTGIEASSDDAIDKAEAWFVSVVEFEETREENQRALASAMVDLRELHHRAKELIEHLNEPLPTSSDLDKFKSELAEAVDVEQEATRRLALLRAAQERVANYDPAELPRLQAKLVELGAAVEAAQRKVDYFSQDPRRAGKAAGQADDGSAVSSGGAEAPVKPWWEGGRAASLDNAAKMSGLSSDAIDVYLLSRAAQLRMVARGESLPLIIDSALEGVPQEQAAKTLHAMAKVSAIVQVVYLAGGDFAEKWAKKQDIYSAAAVRLERI